MNFLTALMNALPGAVAQGLIWGIMAIGVYITYPHSGCCRPDGGRLPRHRRRGVRHADLRRREPCGWPCCAPCWPACWRALSPGLFHTAVRHPRHSGRHSDPAGAVVHQPAHHGQARPTRPSAWTSMTCWSRPALCPGRWRLNNPIFVAAHLLRGGHRPCCTGSSARSWAAPLRATGANPSTWPAPRASTPNVNKVLGLMVSNGLVALSGAPAGPVSGLRRHQHGPRRHRHRPGRRHHRRGALRQDLPQLRAQAARPCPSAPSSTTSSCRSCCSMGLNTN